MLAGLRSDLVAVADCALPEPKAMAPSSAVLLRTKPAAAAHGKNVPAPLPGAWVRNGSTQVQSVGVSTVGRLSKPPAPWSEVFRMPQPPPAVVWKGTSTLWVTSMIESTTPAAPQ